MSNQDFLSTAKAVFADEANEIHNVSSRLDEDFNQAVDLVLKSQGRVVVSGMGKSGLTYMT